MDEFGRHRHFPLKIKNTEFLGHTQQIGILSSILTVTKKLDPDGIRKQGAQLGQGCRQGRQFAADLNGTGPGKLQKLLFRIGSLEHLVDQGTCQHGAVMAFAIRIAIGKDLLQFLKGDQFDYLDTFVQNGQQVAVHRRFIVC